MRSFALLAAAVAAALVNGCALLTPPKQEDVQAQALPNLKTPAAWAAKGGAQGAVADSWLAGFRDPALEAFVREALEFNPDLRLAAARIERAAAYATQAGAKLYPQVNLLARGGGKMSGDSSGLEGVGVFASWELDLWGRVRSGREAARLEYASVELDAEYAQQSIAALVTKSWFLATEARLQKALAESMVAAAQQLASLARDRERIGKGDAYDVALAQASVQSYLDAVHQLDLAYQQALRALEALAGRYPATAAEVPAQLASKPAPVPVGMPSELLERRPDVVAAERRVAAAFHRVEEAKTARLPQISLTASATSISSELFVLKNTSNPVIGLGASLLWPLFTGGALQSQVEIRTAEQKMAVAEYGRIGARAFGEVENALSSEFTLEERAPILVRAVAENERALELANTRFRVGSGDLRGVQERQLALYAARTTLLRVQAEQLVQRVNLYLALGGGFDARPAGQARAPGAGGQ